MSCSGGRPLGDREQPRGATSNLRGVISLVARAWLVLSWPASFPPSVLPIHDLVHLPLFFNVFRAGKAQSSLHYPRGLFPSLPCFRKKCSLHGRFFFPCLSRSRFSQDSFVYIPPTVKWNTIRIHPNRVRSLLTLLTRLLTSLTPPGRLVHDPHPYYPSIIPPTPPFPYTHLSSRLGPVFEAGCLSSIPSWATRSIMAFFHKTSPT